MNWHNAFRDNKIELQVLATGHIAPFNDPDIKENNLLHNQFPHGKLVGEELMALVPKGSTVIDAGAFIGDNTFEFLNAGWKVIAFEPFYDSWICACVNAPGATIINRPLGNGERVEFVYSCHGDNHGMRSMRLSENGIETARIDDLKLKSCAFIKIDVEGFEPYVLDGALKTIQKFKPVLFIEANPEQLQQQGFTTDDLERKIISLGYSTKMVGCPPRWDWMCLPL